MKIKIIGMDHTGKGIGKIDDKVIFIPKTITGDECEIDIYKQYKKYDVGRVKEIAAASSERVAAKCPYYLICGGCNISNLPYDKQVEFKVAKIKNIFKKYLAIEVEPNVIPSLEEYRYRNKITYHNGASLGLIGEDMDIVDIQECLLVGDKVNQLYKLIKQEDLKQVKMVTIRECDNGLILIIDGKIGVDKLKDKCISIYINNKCVYKKEDGYINIGDIRYKVSPNSFFQINTSNISRLYNEIVKYGSFNKNDRVIDLYCGVGSISLYIAKYAKEVLGIEIIEDAVRDAQDNAQLNGITNAKFLAGDVAKLIDDKIRGDILIVDPPRIGLDEHTIDIINKTKIKKLIYVSCDPMTLVRDLKLLDNYVLKDVSVVDMFPQTHHVECVTLLCRRK